MTSDTVSAETSKINRLILVGNGFDLAHGLKTSYNDFILWYMKKVFNLAYDKKEYNDDQINIRRANHNDIGRGGVKNVNDFIEYYYRNGFMKMIGPSKVKFIGYDNDFPNPFVTKIVNNLFKILITSCNECNWVDVENEYYIELQRILYKVSAEDKKVELEKLNKSMTSLILELHEYLNQLKSNSYNEEFRKIISEPVYYREIVTIPMFGDEVVLESMILNFNYTDTIEYYLDDLSVNFDGSVPKVNYIHGRLNTSVNPLIFGFGDELDEHYTKLELDKIKGFFTYIKSFWYYRTTNYHNLIRFINSGNFQVYILGHSCGLSDRTMLNMIFEDPNCISIKIFYHQHSDGKNNFTELTQEISRHFTSKSGMRKKIVPMKLSSRMPQV